MRCRLAPVREGLVLGVGGWVCVGKPYLWYAWGGSSSLRSGFRPLLRTALFPTDLPGTVLKKTKRAIHVYEHLCVYVMSGVCALVCTGPGLGWCLNPYLLFETQLVGMVGHGARACPNTR